MLVNVSLESRETQLVSILKISIVLSILLHSIISQMDEGIINILEVNTELAGRCPQVALLEEIQVMVLVEKHPDPNVEFPLENQQWPLDVLLNDKCVVLDLLCIRGLVL